MSESTPTTTIVKHDDGTTVVTTVTKIKASTGAAADVLVTRLTSGLEPKTFDRLTASGELRSKKIGRRVYARLSDILALIDAKPVETPVDVTDDLQVALDKKARRASR